MRRIAPPAPLIFERRLDEWLDRLRGIAYLVDARGRVRAYGRRNWDRFAIANDAPELARPEAVRGASVLEAIADASNRAICRGLLDLLLDGKRQRVRLDYRCDSPVLGREMTMQMILLRVGPREQFVLHRTLERRTFPLGPEAIRRQRTQILAAHNQPLLRVCSYCEKIQPPGLTADAPWMRPQMYYASGGSGVVRLTHGICPVCYAHVIRPQLEAYFEAREERTIRRTAQARARRSGAEAKTE